MSEPLAESLSRFTPDASGLNRDALLFAAGRASVRPNRRWQLVAGVLAASQVLTLAAFWPRTSYTQIDTPIAIVQQSENSPSSIPHDPSAWGILSERLLASEGDWIAPADEGPMVSPEPPLHEFGPLPAKYFN
jgi:hypothetical protein